MTGVDLGAWRLPLLALPSYGTLAWSDVPFALFCFASS